MIFYAYVLRSLKDKNLYIGYTSDIHRRLTEHNSGKTKSTKSRIPFELIFFEEFETRSEAMKREKFLKSGMGKDFIKLKFQELKA